MNKVISSDVYLKVGKYQVPKENKIVEIKVPSAQKNKFCS